MGWGNIYKRRVKVFAVALIIYFDYKALQQREKWANKSKKASLWEKAHERNARRVLNLIVELEGLWVKLGQYLSTRADVLPEAYICLLKQLQDSLPPRSLKEVCQTIEKELGKTMDDLFLDFDKVPLATASIAQVHRATLSDGQEVVVKVQHDGIKEVILEDLKNAKSIVDWIAWAEPQYNFHPMIDEWCKESPKELDFNHEAENTRKVSRNLHCNKTCDDSKPANHVDVLIPEVIQSTEKVLILEYMDGVRLNDAESLRALGVDKQKLVEEITRAYGHQIYVDGFFNGDPHPGNFLVSKEPPHRPILLDFGLTKLLSSSLKQALAKMFLAAAEGDHVALLAAFAEMGLKFRLDVPEQAMEVTSMFFRSSTPANEALASMKMLSEQRSKNFKVIQEKMKLNEKEVKRFNPVDAFPSDIVIFGRVLNLLRGLSATMNVRIVYIDIMRPFAESVLQCNINVGPSLNPRWIYDTPIHSDVEAKLRQLLVELGNAEKILGIQVCAYKDGEVIIDTAAGVLGKYDPRPVQPDSLFTVFSATKGICAGLVHWLVDNGFFNELRARLFSLAALRAQFIIECLNDLKRNLVKRGLDLLVQHGKPEEIIPLLAKAYNAHTVYAHKETCSEEVKVEKLVTRNLQKLVSPSSGGLGNEPGTINTTKLELVWGSTMYHIEDLPFDCESLPDVYTQFRKSVESKSKIRNCTRLPTSFGPPPEVGDWGQVPQVTELGLQLEKVSKGVKFIGGESAALGRVHDYFWKKDLLKVYKETRNGMLGPDYSTKFSPWLASGSLSPRFIYEEVKRYEKERQSNDSTYWVLFELIWRDYFRFLSIKLGNLLFQAGGPQKVNINWSQDQTMFDAWRGGQTGYPLIDANMKELATTGFMSNRGRQIVCSFLVRDMGIDWRMGAEWFETCLLDYDPCSNYGNWTYGAGVGNDPREDRYFSIPKQAQSYDPEGEFVAYWLPELKALPREKRHSPGMMYLNPIVALKHGYTKKTGDSKKAFSSRRGRPDDNRRKWQGDGRKY